MNHLVSIGLPVVKSLFLEKAITSVLSQTYDNIELIILNNAAQTETKKEIYNIVHSFDARNIKYFENETQIPMIPNWNLTLEKATGEFFALLCDDDIWESRFIEEMVLLAEIYPDTNLFHSRVAIIDENDKIIKLSQICPEYELGLDFIYHRLAGYRFQFLSDFLVRTRALKEIGGFTYLPDGWGSDDMTWFKLAIKEGVVYSSKILFKYRVSQINVSNTNKIKNKLSAVDLQYSLLNNLIKHNDQSNDKFDSIKIQMIKDSMYKFKDKGKGNLIKNLLISKYKIPLPLAIAIVSGYRLYIRNTQKYT